MKVVIRVDASIQMGTGHVMRCLTLAEALREEGAEVHFVSRSHTGNLIELVQSKGFKVFVLPKGVYEYDAGDPAHASWLEESWSEDAEQTKRALGKNFYDWFIVDHYALNDNWERALREYSVKLMIIDDLADRNHDCDVLLDQTFGRREADYRGCVPSSCVLLVGAQYALLRSEFASWRDFSLSRRGSPELKKLLIFLGGADPDNLTGQVLDKLIKAKKLDRLETTIVMGQTAPWLDKVCEQAQVLSADVKVLSGVNNMAELMAHSDLMIGAAGTTSWERCCLGVPSFVFCLADNQKLICEKLDNYGALEKVKSSMDVVDKLKNINVQKLKEMSFKSSTITNGLGTKYVVESIL